MNKYWLIGLVGVALFGCEKTTNVQNVYCNTNADCKNPLYPQCYPQVHSCGQANLDLGGFDIGVPDMASDMPSSADLLPPPDLLPMCTTATVSVCVDPAKPVCGASGNCAACTAADDGQCSAKVSGNVCITTGANIGQCGQCNPSPSPMESGKCLTPTIPVCGSDGTCRKCQANSECSTNVCLPNGSCAAPGTVVYVNNGNGCTGATHAGTVADPYCQVNDGIMNLGSKTVISVAASATAYNPVMIMSGTFTIVGANNAVPPGSGTTSKIKGNGAAAITATGTTANVKLVGLEIVGMNISVDGVDCGAAGGGPTLEFDNCYVHGNGGSGINAQKCNLTMTGNTVSGNTGGAGISTSGGTLALIGNIVSGNSAGGLTTSSSPYLIVNNFLVTNTGGPGVTFSVGSSGLFWFNTVADNDAGIGLPGALLCNAATLTQASIIFNNSKTTGTGLSYSAAGCTFDYTYIDDGTTPTGSGNFKAPASPSPFVTVGAYKYAIAAGSAAEGVVQANSAGLMPMGSPLPMTDIAGNARPRSASPAGYDVGAYQGP